MRRIGSSGIIKIYIFTSAVDKVKGERRKEGEIVTKVRVDKESVGSRIGKGTGKRKEECCNLITIPLVCPVHW